MSDPVEEAGSTPHWTSGGGKLHPIAHSGRCGATIGCHPTETSLLPSPEVVEPDTPTVYYTWAGGELVPHGTNGAVYDMTLTPAA